MRSIKRDETTDGSTNSVPQNSIMTDAGWLRAMQGCVYDFQLLVEETACFA